MKIEFRTTQIAIAVASALSAAAMSAANAGGAASVQSRRAGHLRHG